MTTFNLAIQDYLTINEVTKTLKLKELEIEEIKNILKLKAAVRAVAKKYEEFLNDLKESLITPDVADALKKQQAKKELTDAEKQSIENANVKFTAVHDAELTKNVEIEIEPLDELVIAKMIKYSDLSIEGAELLYQLIE